MVFFLFLFCLIPLFADVVESNRTFLSALEEGPFAAPHQKNLRERVMYQKALRHYLETFTVTAEWEAKIKKELEEHPNFASLHYFLAIAAHEKGEWERFYREFYTAYVSSPDDFLAHREKGIIYASVYEHARSEKEKEYLRKATYQNATLALAEQPKDIEVQKLKILFSKPEQKGESIRSAINEIGVVPKDDVRFFVIQAVDAGEKKLAQDFLDKAKGWYTASRIIDRSQRYIDKAEE